MIKRIFLISLLALLLLASPALAQEGKGIIKGQLVNKTKDGGSVAGQEVTLKTLRGDNEIASSTNKSDASGSFVFPGLSTDTLYSYKATIKYQGADYESDTIKFGTGETSKSITLTVYDATTNPQDIAVSRAHTIIYMEKGDMTVMEYLLFFNRGDKTYVGSKDLGDGRKETLKFSLPKGATELQYRQGLMECCVVPVEGGFVDTMAFIGGSTNEVIYTYKVKKPSDKYLFSQTLFFPVANYDLMIQDTGIQAASELLTPQEPVAMEGIRFTRLSAQDLAAGTSFSASLTGLRQSGSSASTPQAAIIVVLALSALGFGYLLLFRRRQPAMAKARAGRGAQGERERLLVEIAQLDDSFEERKIPQERYRRLRAQKKARLVELLKRSRKQEDGTS